MPRRQKYAELLGSRTKPGVDVVKSTGTRNSKNAILTWYFGVGFKSVAGLCDTNKNCKKPVLNMAIKVVLFIFFCLCLTRKVLLKFHNFSEDSRPQRVLL